MAQEKQLQNNNISQFNGGLHTDNSLGDSPKGTYSFCLNGVNETELGDFGCISNEESNEQCASLTTGYTPIGTYPGVREAHSSLDSSLLIKPKFPNSVSLTELRANL